MDTWKISAKLKLPSMLTLIVADLPEKLKLPSISTLIVADLPEKLKLPSILTIIADKKCGCRNSKLRV